MKKSTQDTTTRKTITCNHCRYERPADDKQCHICGYPWPFAAPQNHPPRKKGTTKR